MPDNTPASEPTRSELPDMPPTPGDESDPQFAPGPYAAENPYAAPNPYATPAAATPVERIGRGLALSLLAIPVAMILTGVIWRLGFVASLSAFVLAALAVILYRRGSGGPIKRGIPGLVVVILLGTVACFFSAVLTDLVQYYGKQSPADQSSLGTLRQFVSANLFYGPVLSSYSKDMVLFGLFAVLGIFGTIVRLVRSARTA